MIGLLMSGSHAVNQEQAQGYFHWELIRSSNVITAELAAASNVSLKSGADGVRNAPARSIIKTRKKSLDIKSLFLNSRLATRGCYLRHRRFRRTIIRRKIAQEGIEPSVIQVVALEFAFLQLLSVA